MDEWMNIFTVLWESGMTHGTASHLLALRLGADASRVHRRRRCEYPIRGRMELRRGVCNELVRYKREFTPSLVRSVSQKLDTESVCVHTATPVIFGPPVVSAASPLKSSKYKRRALDLNVDRWVPEFCVATQNLHHYLVRTDSMSSDPFLSSARYKSECVSRHRLLEARCELPLRPGTGRYRCDVQRYNYHSTHNCASLMRCPFWGRVPSDPIVTKLVSHWWSASRAQMNLPGKATLMHPAKEQRGPSLWILIPQWKFPMMNGNAARKQSAAACVGRREHLNIRIHARITSWLLLWSNLSWGSGGKCWSRTNWKWTWSK